MLNRPLAILVSLCSFVLASAQKTFLSMTVKPVDAATETQLTQARVALLNPTDSSVVDTLASPPFSRHGIESKLSCPLA